MWNHIISYGYEWETYEISEAQDTWPDCEAFTSREAVKQELDISNHRKSNYYDYYGGTISD